MLIQPKVRGFICTAAHPKGCYEAVKQQVDYVKSQGEFEGPKNVLVIGASTGYGLSSRIVASFGCHAKTIGVFFEKAASGKRTASAGWYNSAAFEKIAHSEGQYAKSINGDAFSDEIKEQTAALIKADLGKVDCVIYSLASPRRKHPKTDAIHCSTLKPTQSTFEGKTVDPMSGDIKTVSLAPASQEEIDDTVAVMGGEDWAMWVDYLAEQGVLADDFTTVAYTYIGPELTHSIYKEGTIGQAKKHLHHTAAALSQKYAGKGRAFISVNKAVVTQASSAIPVVPLYMSILFKLMKEKGTHEGCIEQMERLFKDNLYSDTMASVDAEGRVRLDDLEMQPDIQKQVHDVWQQVTSDNMASLSDLAGYQTDFYQLFGFKIPGVDYEADVDAAVEIPSIKTKVC